MVHQILRQVSDSDNQKEELRPETPPNWRAAQSACGAQNYGLEFLALPKDSPIVKKDEVYEREMPTIPSLRRPLGHSGGRGDAPVLPCMKVQRMRMGAGRVMLRAYRRGAGHRVQGLR
jgi:hypothetical protein